MRKKMTKDQIRRIKVSNMDLKTRLMMAKQTPRKRPIRGHVFNRVLMAKQTPRKRKAGIIKLPDKVMVALGFPIDAWG